MARVLICTPTHYLQGGVERIMESLARHLPSRGFEVVFALAKGKRFHDPDAFRRAFPDVRGVDVDGTSGTVYGRRRALRRVMFETDPDVVLIARMFDAYPVASALKRAGHRLRLAVTVQAFEREYFVDLARYREFVDVCVTSGRRILDEVQRMTSVPAVSIPGGVASPHRMHASNDGPLRIGYVGRLEQVQKRVRDLPLLVEELERRAIPFTLDVAGDGTLLEELRSRLPRARMHGWLSTTELYERVYPELDVLVHFAEYEGLTIAPREAMAHGVVPVTSLDVGSEDFIDGENALRFPIGDIGAAADAIERLHRDRALLEKLSGAARVSQQGIRSEQGAIDAWAAAFRDALARPARVGGALPPASRDEGFLTRLGVPDSVAELLVRGLRKRAHDDPGSEWPHAG
ncbi:MAG TPA: glycosyltransferase family 4 protein [Thermoanaerobaculia bacterium]|nr:glycosyltransferase family 4 protein [Thermoanaerobaculia bacterium]